MNEERPLSVGRSHHRRSDGKAPKLSPRLILFLIVAIVLLYGVIYPNIHVVVASFQQNGNWSLANYVQALSQAIVLESIVASVGVSVLTVLFCAAAGSTKRHNKAKQLNNRKIFTCIIVWLIGL